MNEIPARFSDIRERAGDWSKRMSKTNPKVDQFIEKAKRWQDEFKELRRIALDFDLQEELKWGNPCYTSGGNNVVLIHGFKEYCAYLFFKGALMKDPAGILVQQTENVQSSRQVRFTSLEQIRELEPELKVYIREAIEVEKAGLKVAFKPTREFVMVDELRERLAQDPELADAFEKLTPGRQRAYLLYFSQAKQSTTRLSRIEKSAPDILIGKGLNDR
jgi:uncharacterized protein YdeI (YjbR/CyaY-like superfamily)